MKKKIVLVFAVLLTSAAALSLILATSRYVGFLRHPEGWRQLLAFQVEPPRVDVAGLTVEVTPVWGESVEVSSLLVSTFWIFEISAANTGDTPVDVNFDRVTLRVTDREVNALSTDAVLRLFNERMTGAYGTAAGRRGYQEALEQLQAREFGVSRVFPGYTRKSLVFFQPLPEIPDKAELTLRGIRRVGGREEVSVGFGLRRGTRAGGAAPDGT